MTQNKNEKPSAPETLDDAAIEDIVGGGIYSLSSNSLLSLSYSWLSVNGVQDDQVDEYSQPTESPDATTKPSYPTIKL